MISVKYVILSDFPKQLMFWLGLHFWVEKYGCILVKASKFRLKVLGATIVDLSVTVALDSDYQLPPAALAERSLQVTGNKAPGDESAFQKAEDVVSGMLAKGFILGKDAISKAKGFDEKHQLTSTASAKVVSFDKKIGLTEKISASTTVVGDKVREVDQKFQVSEKTKSAFAAAEQKVSSAGSAIMSNRYVFTGAAWVTGAFNKVAKAARGCWPEGQRKGRNGGRGTKEERWWTTLLRSTYLSLPKHLVQVTSSRPSLHLCKV
ncbi:BINDING PARTNER OF ACD11 1 [Salix viminalis]|uniref:BINDING PARTNER OF ACD11 1 n=1 Tax=Salix viminalis TaxID=40686 RepID=A0A9Q0TN90_SALVM|nr:BINDING PARTNER OF ACD11 1 [Salix viminalis]